MIAVVVQCSLTLWYVHAFSKLGVPPSRRFKAFSVISELTPTRLPASFAALSEQLQARDGSLFLRVLGAVLGFGSSA